MAFNNNAPHGAVAEIIVVHEDGFERFNINGVVSKSSEHFQYLVNQQMPIQAHYGAGIDANADYDRLEITY